MVPMMVETISSDFAALLKTPLTIPFCTTSTRTLFDFTLDNHLEIIAAAIHHKKSGTPMEITAKGIYLGKRDTVTASLFVTELFTYVSSGCTNSNLMTTFNMAGIAKQI